MPPASKTQLHRTRGRSPARLAISLQSVAFAWPLDRSRRDTHAQDPVAFPHDRVVFGTRRDANREIYVRHGGRGRPVDRVLLDVQRHDRRAP